MMAKEKKKVPNLRFKGFTDDWEQRKLGDIVSFAKGSGYSKKDLSEKGTPIILYGRLYTKYETVIKNVATLTKVKNDTVYSNGGEVIVPASGETAEDIARASVVDAKGIVLGGDLNIIHPNEDINSIFLALSISNGTPHKEMAKRAQGKSIVHLHNSDLAHILLNYPSMREQEKISLYFQHLDNLITLHQRKLDLLNQLKNGFLQKMFADKDSKRPVLQFKIFHDDWEQRKLGDLIKEFSIKSKIEDEYKVLSSTNSGMKFREGRVTGTSNLGYKIIKNGDLVLSPQNLWLGNININNIGKGLVSPSYKTFKLINIDSSFINPQLRTQKMLEEYKNSSTQGASVVRRNLEIDSFYQIKIFVPTISEQEKIGSFFQRLDNTIVLQHQKLAKCQSVKKSLLQQMFI